MSLRRTSGKSGPWVKAWATGARSSYRFMTEQVLALDGINPQPASRMVRNFERYKRYEPGRRALMRAALEQVAAKPGLSREVAEVVGKAFA